MAYIGNPPITGNFQVCDAISVVNGQAAYTMQVSSANVTPESANHMLVSLNGVLQKPNSSFTISGSTITFASNLATGDVIDFIILLGNVLDLGVPSDATVTDAKANFVSTSSAAGLQIKGDGTTDGTLQLNCSQNSHGIKLRSPAHSNGQSYTLTFPTGNVTADKFLKVASVSGSGTTGIGQLSFADAGGGQWEYISSSTISSGTSAVDFTTLSTTYEDFLFTLQNVHQATDGQRLYGRVFTGTGGSQAVVTSGNYGYAISTMTTGHSTEGSNGTDHMRFSYNNGADTAESYCAEIILYNPHGTTFEKLFRINGVGLSSANATHMHSIASKYDQATAVTGVRFYSQSGNLDSGKISLYGRKNS